MSRPSSDPDEIRRTAANLFVRGQGLEKQEDYYAALDSYRKSLELVDNKAVEAAMLAVLAIVGPE